MGESKLVPVWNGKGERDNVSSYRGIAVMDTLYRLYAKILNERLRAELEDKELLNCTQFECREGRGAMEAV